MIASSAIPYAVLVTAFAAGVWASAGRRRAGRITGAMLVGYTLTGFAGSAFFEMDRRKVLAAGEAGLRNSFHPRATAVMSLFMLVAMGYGATLLGRRFRYYTYAAILTLVVFGVLTSLMVDQMVANRPTPWMGIEERVNIYATMLWVAVLSIGLLRRAPKAANTPKDGRIQPAAI